MSQLPPQTPTLLTWGSGLPLGLHRQRARADTQGERSAGERGRRLPTLSPSVSLRTGPGALAPQRPPHPHQPSQGHSPTDGSPARTLLEAAKPALERLAADDIILLREEAKMSCMVLRITGTGQSRICTKNGALMGCGHQNWGFPTTLKTSRGSSGDREADLSCGGSMSGRGPGVAFGVRKDL